MFSVQSLESEFRKYLATAFINRAFVTSVGFLCTFDNLQILGKHLFSSSKSNLYLFKNLPWLSLCHLHILRLLFYEF